MPLKIVRNDITKIECDAIVNAANSSLLGGGGVDGAIHKAAGNDLLLECMKLGGCKTGRAKITNGYNLPCKYVIHTVGPKWHGGNNGEKELLESCYKNSLALAKENNCESVAFPLISSGIYGYPKDEALHIAVDMITSFLALNDMLVYIVVFDKSTYRISEKLFADITSFIDDNYVDTHFEYRRTFRNNTGESEYLCQSVPMSETCAPTASLPDLSLKKLSLDEAEEMLMKAGFALSHSNKFDIIVEYFIKQNNYNIFEINEALFAFDQNLLGC